jgi:hypothetical protein
MSCIILSVGRATVKAMRMFKWVRKGGSVCDEVKGNGRFGLCKSSEARLARLDGS